MVRAIGVDIGGTNLRLGLVSPEGKILKRHTIFVGEDRQPSQLIGHIREIVVAWQKFYSQGQWVLGAGIPGIVNSRQGMVYSSPHFPTWKNVPYQKLLTRAVGFPVTIDNDAKMIARGEMWKGAARDWGSFLMITLGTGIGGALVIHQRVIHGTRGFTGEFGHMVIESNGPTCACGSHGCFETFISSTALVRMACESLGKGLLPNRLRKIEPAQLAFKISQLARKGHPEALRLYHQMAYFLGIGLASLINITGVEKVVIGGGMSGAADILIPPALAELKKRTYKETAKAVEIRVAELGNDAGILGSVHTVFSLARR